MADFSMFGPGATPQASVANLANVRATAEYKQAIAQKAMMDVAAQKRFMQLMGQQQVPSTPQDMTSQMYNMADLAMRSGMLTKAQGLAQAASRMAAAQAENKFRQVEMTNAQVKGRVQMLNAVGQILGSAHDQASWEHANQEIYRLTGQPSEYANTPYSPALVRQLQQMTLSAKDRMMQQARQEGLNLEAQRNAEVAKHNAVMENLAAQRAKIAREREQRVAKTGGKTAGVPNTQMITDISTILGKMDPGLAGTDLYQTAYAVASHAKTLQQRNHALDSDTAIQQAIEWAKTAGVLQVTSGITGTDVSLHEKGITPETPLPASAAGKEADRVVGRYYQNASGKIYQWTKEGWIGPIGGQ